MWPSLCGSEMLATEGVSLTSGVDCRWIRKVRCVAVVDKIS